MAIKVVIDDALYAHLFGIGALHVAAKRAQRIDKFENGPVITVTDYRVEKPSNVETAYREF